MKPTLKNFTATVELAGEIRLHIAAASEKEAKKIAEHISQGIVIDNSIYQDNRVWDVEENLDAELTELEASSARIGKA